MSGYLSPLSANTFTPADDYNDIEKDAIDKGIVRYNHFFSFSYSQLF